MDDWESEDFAPVAPAIKKEVKGQWDDEDVDEDNVKESWEDEDAAEPPKPQVPVQDVASRTATKAAGKKPKPSAAKSTEVKAKEVGDNTPLDPVAEKLRQQRIVEEADFKSTAELFARTGDEKTLDNFIPKSEIDFMEYAELVSHKLRPFEKSYHYINLLKAVMRLSVTSLKGAEAKEVASSLMAIANEKIKSEKEVTSKKKQGTKKKQLHVDKPDEEAAVGEYDALDDYDFM